MIEFLTSHQQKQVLTPYLIQPYQRDMKIDLYSPSAWDIPLFPVTVAAAAAGIEPGTLRIWFQRGFMLFEKDQPAAGNGLAHTLTFRTVLHIAAAAKLVAKGTKVADAYQAAVHWVHVGSSDRDPAGLFENGDGKTWTYLIHHKGPQARVVRAQLENGNVLLAFSDLEHDGSEAPPTLVPLNKIDFSAHAVCDEYVRGLAH